MLHMWIFIKGVLTLDGWDSKDERLGLDALLDMYSYPVLEKRRDAMSAKPDSKP